MTEKLYLAADSGGSKTKWILCENFGKRISEFETAGLGATGDGILPVKTEIAKAYEHFKSYTDIGGIFLSLGGANTQEVREALEYFWHNTPVKVEREACGDAILAGASFLGASAVVMCGTGSVAVGNTKKGRVFCGGWGPVYGDGGSGGGIGSEALKLYLRYTDGLCNIGRLAELFKALENGLDLSDFYQRMELKRRALALSRRELASLAPKIYDLAREGDSTCMELYDKAATEIALMADRVSDEGGRILLCGGFFANKPDFTELCGQKLSDLNKSKAFMYNPDFSPAVSAVTAVLENNGIEITEEMFFKILKGE